MGACFSVPPADAVVRHRAAEEQGDDGFGGEKRCTGELEGQGGSGATAGKVPARPNAVPDGGSKRSRAATRWQAGGGLWLPGEYLLAAERSRGSGTVPVARLEPESPRYRTAALPLDQRLALRFT